MLHSRYDLNNLPLKCIVKLLQLDKKLEIKISFLETKHHQSICYIILALGEILVLMLWPGIFFLRFNLLVIAKIMSIIMVDQAKMEISCKKIS